jgi:hypothetical protein
MNSTHENFVLLFPIQVHLDMKYIETLETFFLRS